LKRAVNIAEWLLIAVAVVLGTTGSLFGDRVWGTLLLIFALAMLAHRRIDKLADRDRERR
jgi:hypothetical protein